MKNQDHFRILPMEMSITLISVILGVGILTIPRTLAEELHSPDGWFSVIIGGLVTMFLLYLYVQLQKRFPGQDLLQFISAGRIGKWIAACLAFSFIIFYTFLLGYVARILSLVIKMFLLDQTPSEIIVALTLLLSSYAVSKGIQGIVHLNLMFLPIIVAVLLGVLVLNLPEVKLDALLPIFSDGALAPFHGVNETLLSFLGIDILFFFMAYMSKENLKVLPLNLGLLFIMFLYVSVILISYTIFTVDVSKYITFPTVELAKEIELPGAFLERLESLFITVWTMTIFTTMAVVQLLGTKIIQKHIFKKKVSNYWPLYILFFAFIIAFLPNNIVEAAQMGEWLGYVGWGLYLFGLAVGYICLWTRRQKPSYQKEA